MRIFEHDESGIYICYADISEVDPNFVPEDFSEYRKKRLSAIKNESARRHSVGAELMLIHAMRRLKIEPPIEYKTDGRGKPYMPSGKVFFSLSHSGTVAVCAVSDKPIGVDIERVRPIRQGVVRRAFTAAEKELIKDDVSFTVLWTRKEAAAKADGGGVSAGLSGIDVTGETTIVSGCRYKIMTINCGLSGYALSVTVMTDGSI